MSPRTKSRACSRPCQSGFTLMELLIAVAIFALIGLAGYRMLNSVVSAYQKTSERTAVFAELKKAVAILDRDLNHIVSRPVKDELGGDLPAVAASFRGGPPLEFSRNGRWRFPDDQHSELLRVAYRVEGDQLQRLVWPVLDRAQDTTPRTQVLLGGVSALSIRVSGDGEAWTSDWPQEDNQGQLNLLQRPVVIDLRFNTLHYGQIQRLVTLDGL